MALAISTPTSSLWHSSSSYNGGKPSRNVVLSNSAVPVRKNSIFMHVEGISQLGFGPFPQWCGLKQLGSSISRYSVKMGKNRKTKGKGVYASLFGVGAPEALVIGVVALLVFGPKGLAEVARNLGKSLRAFQPTIRELQEVSREFKTSLEREIGLDEIDRPVPPYTPKPTSEDFPQELKTNVEPTKSDESSSESGAYTADEYLKVTEAQLKGTTAQLQKEQQQNNDKQSETETSTLGTTEEASSVMPPSKNPESSALQDDASKPQTET